MGTRADFYVGTGPEAEWLGSVCFDGYQWAENENCDLRAARSVEAYRAAVKVILEEDDRATTPDMGWPWPWKTSKTTDYAYYFKDGAVGFTNFDGDWPDMSKKKNVTFGPRSGLIVITRNGITG